MFRVTFLCGSRQTAFANTHSRSQQQGSEIKTKHQCGPLFLMGYEIVGRRRETPLAVQFLWVLIIIIVMQGNEGPRPIFMFWDCKLPPAQQLTLQLSCALPSECGFSLPPTLSPSLFFLSPYLRLCISAPSCGQWIKNPDSGGPGVRLGVCFSSWHHGWCETSADTQGGPPFALPGRDVYNDGLFTGGCHPSVQYLVPFEMC